MRAWWKDPNKSFTKHSRSLWPGIHLDAIFQIGWVFVRAGPGIDIVSELGLLRSLCGAEKFQFSFLVERERERERERKRKFGSYQSSVHFDVSRSLGEKKRKVFKKRRKKKGISVRSKKHASAMGGSDILMSYLPTRIESFKKVSSRQFPTSWTVEIPLLIFC